MLEKRKNQKKETPLRAAIAHGNYSSLKILCEHAGRHLSSLLWESPSGGRRQLSAIQLAIKENNFHVLHILMSYDLGDLTRFHDDLTK